MRTIIQNGFKTGFQQGKIAAIVYVFQLCLALTLGMQVFNVLEASIGHSMEINKLVHGYDHTVLMDFLKIHGASITPLIGQLRWLLLIYLLFSVFIHGGLLYCAMSPSPVSALSFWQGGAKYFFPFLKIGLFFLLAALLWSLLLWVPFLRYFEPSLQYFSSEKYSVWLLILCLIVWLKGLALLFIWSLASRIAQIKTESSLGAALRQGYRSFRKHIVPLLLLLAFFTLLHGVLIGIYLLLESATGMTTAGLTVLFFLVQQVFVFFRIQLRQMLYAGMALATNNQ